jgi:hypothetical protein
MYSGIEAGRKVESLYGRIETNLIDKVSDPKYSIAAHQHSRPTAQIVRTEVS